MINRQNISNFIGDIQGIKLSAGHRIKESGKLKKVQFVDPEKVCVGLIEEDGEINYASLSYQEGKKGLISECDCKSTGKCEHTAALALYLLSNLSNVEVGKNLQLGYLSGFEKTEAKEWRGIQKPEEMSWEDFLNSLKSRKSTSLPVSLIYGTIKPDNSIELIGDLPYYYGNNELINVHLKKIKDGFEIICKGCKETSKKCCKHQTNFLDIIKSNAKLSGWFSEDINYQELRYRYLEQYDFNSEEFDQEFNINFDSNRIYLHPKHGRFFHEDLQYDVSDYIREEKERRDKVNLLDRKGPERYGQAFLWNQVEDFETLPFFGFVEAKFNKSRSKLINSFRTKVYPDKLDERIQNLNKDIQDQLKRNLDDPDAYMKYMFQEMNSKLEWLMDYTHFLNTNGSLDEWQDEYEDSEETKINKKDLLVFEFQPSPLNCTIKSKVKQGFIKMWTEFEIDGKIIKKRPDWHNPLFSIFDQKAYLHDRVYTEIHQSILLNYANLYFPISQKQEFINAIVGAGNYFDVEIDEKLDLVKEELTDGVKELYIEEHGEYISFEPRVNYADVSFNLLTDGYKRVESHLYESASEDTNEFLEFLRGLHPAFDPESLKYDAFFLSYSQLLEGMWFLDFFERCKQAGIVVYGENNLTKLKFNSNTPNINTHIKSQKDWFDVDVDINFGETPVKLKDWVEAMKNKSRYVRLSDGTLGVLPESWFSKLQQIYEMTETVKGQLQVNKFKFNAIEEVFEEQEIEGGDLLKQLAEKKNRLLNFEKEKTYEIPDTVHAELRPYQWVGYQWLKFLDDFQMGGILADEMGLGKTLQVICLLADLKARNISEPNLIIVPRSLLFNWVDEIEKFSPSLIAHVHHGTGRKISSEFFNQQDVIITTYDTAVQDQAKLSKIEFNYIILDESQAIKNPVTKRYQSVMKLHCKNRLAMTGTPIENNTFDLYSQFNFVNPGIFGSSQNFKDRYSIPIDVQDDEKVSKRLQKVISPYLMRRTKKQVAKDLPAKTESVIYCELRPFQRDMYDSLKNKIRNEIIESMKNPASNQKASFLAIEGLLRLRQICNSPYLVDKTLPEHKRESSKLNILTDILSNELGESSALVFSQFTSMLSLIREKLDERGVKYAYLDGSTKNRKEVVDSFQNDPDCHIFLISLKAGNTGLNLTKAEYVYIVDPWWNPAVEAQAIDRTHRIGQDKHIIAYRMIAENTIEEKIVELQQKKKKIASDLIKTEEDMFKALKKDDLLSLFDL